MAIRFQILGSSSSGNCALLSTDDCKVLIDAGFSAKRLKPMLAAVGESFETIDAVFLTHEHSDHSAGLRGLGRYEHLRFFANRDTANCCQKKLTRRLNWQIFETGREFEFRGLKVNSFCIPHDAHDPVGYVFECGGGSLFSPRTKIGWATDLGYVPQLVRERVRDCDVLVLESNYDSDMLDSDERRPWALKQRIRGRHGHLGNTAAFEYVSEESSAKWQHLYLGHLSKECNAMAIVQELFDAVGSRFALEVVDPSKIGASQPYESGSAFV